MNTLMFVSDSGEYSQSTASTVSTRRHDGNCH
jgi:hypothetical protein